MLPLLAFLLLALPGSALAHAIDVDAPAAWSLEPWVVIPLGAAAGFYLAGLASLWQRAGAGRGVSRAQAAAFAAGWLLLAGALLGPLDALAAHSFAAHMVQHELLMALAAPLLVLGRPLAVWTWSLPQAARATLPALQRARPVRTPWLVLSAPFAAWALHATAVWGWHVPALFEAALHSEATHALQHLAFLGTALLFWWNAVGAESRVARGTAVLYLFLTMVHTSVLGALLTFSPHPWYAAYAGGDPGSGLDALSDQQLGGLVMWVPGGLSYLVAALAIMARWLAPFGARRA